MASKLILFTLFVFVAILVIYLNNRNMLQRTITYLALGDSYTVGEGVGVTESFPYQTIQLLKEEGQRCNDPEIFATTGWTSSDLRTGIKRNYFQSSYYFVSLLIGVNDQYQGKSTDEYAENLERLIEMAIRFTEGKPAHVFVLSIPDWGITPFATDRDPETIAQGIDAFNTVNETIARRHNVTYITVTDISREAADNPHLLAPDQLHPSGAAYALWAERLAGEMQKVL